jgi:hypothetical protein
MWSIFGDGVEYAVGKAHDLVDSFLSMKDSVTSASCNVDCMNDIGECRCSQGGAAGGSDEFEGLDIHIL